MPQFAERVWFAISLALGKLLRAGRYSAVHTGVADGERVVLKHRRAYAPVLVPMGNVLLRALAAGVRILPQREWEANEQRMYQVLYGMHARADHGVLTLPFLPGETLAAVLERFSEADCARAIEWAATALHALHARGFTHGDAMAENVMIDFERGTARWFDFETAHDPNRSVSWRRADDVRALTATCVLRTTPASAHLIAAIYADDVVLPQAALSFASVAQRPLPFHLGQAALRFADFRMIAEHFVHDRLK